MLGKSIGEIKRDARQFVAKWQGKGQERQDDKTFWEGLLEEVYGVPKGKGKYLIAAQKSVKFQGTTKAIDIYLKDTKVVIEQKSHYKDLMKPERQSDGEMLTAMEQGKRYYDWLDQPEQGRYIIACNFREFRIFDNNHKSAGEKHILLSELPDRWRELLFLVNDKDTIQQTAISEELISLTASSYVHSLYHSMLKDIDAPTADQLHSLNVFCVRVVFCLFAEDAGVFDNEQYKRFLEYYANTDELQERFDHLFEILDMQEKTREIYCRFAPKVLLAFPYVDGGLFQPDQRYKTPHLSKETIKILFNAWNIALPKTKSKFHWSDISPTNFGCIFESTTDKAVRDAGGMHYTTPENIHRLISPLFLDSLKQELDDILKIASADAKERAITAYRNKLSSLRFLDPACGSGNFLTETYKALHELELQAIKCVMDITFQRTYSNTDPCKVQITQFYGIEIDDFAAAVARTSLWIAECQMLQKTEDVLQCSLELLPLKRNPNIICTDALTTNWDNLLRPSTKHVTYIIGNPPFQGSKKMTHKQRESLMQAMPARIGKQKVWESQGELDFVCAWYAKAAEYMQRRNNIKAAFVSTNSIVQGEQVTLLWQPLMQTYKLHILFAWKTFRWFNKADKMAHVHCIIVGFYTGKERKDEQYRIFAEGQAPLPAQNINPYLMDAETLFINNREKPLSDVPEMGIGNKPIDNGNYLFTAKEKEDFIRKEPLSSQYFRPWYGAEEFINRRPRYCLYLAGCTPAELNDMPLCKKRVQAVIDYRRKSKSKETRELAATPRLFHVTNIPESTYMLIPSATSENRRYIPMGYLTADTLSSNAVHIVPDATLYHFGVLESRIHMAWMRLVCGRLKSDYRYSKRIVYNNFPWSNVDEEQKQHIEQTALAILDARNLHPESTLADLYDQATMPVELLRAHQNNDRAVANAFGINLDNSDEDIAMEMLRRSVMLSKPKAKNRKINKSKQKR